MDFIQSPEFVPEFGLSSAHLIRDCLQMQEYIGDKMGWNGDYNAIDTAVPFYSYSASSTFNGLTISSVANSPVYAKVFAQTSSAIFLPTAGKTCRSVVNGKTIHWGANKGGLFAPEGDRSGFFGDCSVLIMDINHQRLQNTLNTMLGKEHHILTHLNDPLELALQHGQIDFANNFKHIVKQIDLYASNPRLLELSGLDDQLYRMAACWMFPHLVLSDQPQSGNHNQLLKRVKDYVYANLHRPITLSELETLTCLSRRTLQLLFMKQTQLSPLKWVKEQRLLMAQQRLQQAKSHETVTEIALSLGFYSSAQFSTLYKQKFGVPPSEHLGRN